MYQASATLGAIGDVAGLPLFATQDDYRWMFWYFGLHPSEFPLSVQFALVLLEGRYAYCLVVQLVCDMGRSPISNICSHVSLKHVSSWANQMDAVMPEVMRTYNLETRQLLEARAERFGPLQARAFWGSSFTDDVILLTLGTRATIVGTDLWDKSCYKCNIRMTDFVKRVVGTAPLHIGARFVLNGHFGCVPPDKRARCLAGIRAALEGRAIRDEFESNCGLVGHIALTLSLDRTLLHGIKRPLGIAAYPTSVIALTNDGHARHVELEFHISVRNAASFASAIADSSLIYDLPGAPAFNQVEIRMGSDACTGSAEVPNPAVFCMCHEFAVIFYLTGRWENIPITGTETLGAIINLLVFPPLFPWARLVNETDASATHAFLIGRSRAPPLQRARAVLNKLPEFQEAARRTSSQAVAGRQHVMVDAGSRGYDDVLAGWLGALNMRLRLLTLTDHHLRVIEQVLRAMEGDGEGPGDWNADVEGGVAFYDNQNEVIKYTDLRPYGYFSYGYKRGTKPDEIDWSKWPRTDAPVGQIWPPGHAPLGTEQFSMNLVWGPHRKEELRRGDQDDLWSDLVYESECLGDEWERWHRQQRLGQGLRPVLDWEVRHLDDLVPRDSITSDDVADLAETLRWVPYLLSLRRQMVWQASYEFSVARAYWASWDSEYDEEADTVAYIRPGNSGVITVPYYGVACHAHYLQLIAARLILLCRRRAVSIRWSRGLLRRYNGMIASADMSSESLNHRAANDYVRGDHDMASAAAALGASHGAPASPQPPPIQAHRASLVAVPPPPHLRLNRVARPRRTPPGPLPGLSLARRARRQETRTVRL